VLGRGLPLAAHPDELIEFLDGEVAVVLPRCGDHLAEQADLHRQFLVHQERPIVAVPIPHGPA